MLFWDLCQRFLRSALVRLDLFPLSSLETCPVNLIPLYNPIKTLKKSRLLQPMNQPWCLIFCIFLILKRVFCLHHKVPGENIRRLGQGQTWGAPPGPAPQADRDAAFSPLRLFHRDSFQLLTPSPNLYCTRFSTSYTKASWETRSKGLQISVTICPITISCSTGLKTHFIKLTLCSQGTNHYRKAVNWRALLIHFYLKHGFIDASSEPIYFLLT